MRMLELLEQAGLPKGVVNLLTTSRKEAELLLTHPSVKGISYVGSSSVGRYIYATAASNGKRVQVLGEAKNHGLVLRDANLEMAARIIINSTFGCAGMRCMALPVIVVEEAVADEFLMETAHRLDVPLPLTAMVLEFLQVMKTAGEGDLDHSGLVRLYERIAKTEVMPMNPELPGQGGDLTNNVISGILIYQILYITLESPHFISCAP